MKVSLLIHYFRRNTTLEFQTALKYIIYSYYAPVPYEQSCY
jgi:hypothetical protein